MGTLVDKAMDWLIATFRQDKRTIARLITTLQQEKSGGGFLSSSTLDSFRRLGEPCVAGLVSLLNDPFAHVRAGAAEALGEIGSRTAVKDLLSRLEDSAEVVVRDAAHALGKIGDPTAAPVLTKALAKSAEHTRSWIAHSLKSLDCIPSDGITKALYWIGLGHFEQCVSIGSDAVDVLAKCVAEKSDKWSQALDALVKIGRPSIPALSALARASTGYVNTSILEALERIDDRAAIDSANEIKADREKTVMANRSTLEAYWQHEAELLWAANALPAKPHCDSCGRPLERGNSYYFVAGRRMKCGSCKDESLAIWAHDNYPENHFGVGEIERATALSKRDSPWNE